ncbi:hypothetical protein FN846DRAFT_980107 [Sphaerosporella brunnea]|uniref:Uncharacterized protein n=1 Tax=Sphaerosporella brunnea TaxID=1250544 RepID=A0A5J5EEM5_9PEZI|nr:hypothetical protein FN846DRAFT_980107 [Sphaerosporella brunnea]
MMFCRLHFRCLLLLEEPDGTHITNPNPLVVVVLSAAFQPEPGYGGKQNKTTQKRRGTYSSPRPLPLLAEESFLRCPRLASELLLECILKSLVLRIFGNFSEPPETEFLEYVKRDLILLVMELVFLWHSAGEPGFFSAAAAAAAAAAAVDGLLLLEEEEELALPLGVQGTDADKTSACCACAAAGITFAVSTISSRCCTSTGNGPRAFSFCGSREMLRRDRLRVEIREIGASPSSPPLGDGLAQQKRVLRRELNIVVVVVVVAELGDGGLLLE